MRNDFRRREVRDGEKILGELFVMQSRPGRPSWLRLFKGAVVPLPMLATMSTGAVLLIERRGRMLAATFGQGRHLLRPGTWVENFGLRVALNSIEPGKIRSLEHKRFDAVARLSRTQGAGDATVQQLGVDVERDVLRALTGTDRRLGSRVTGADALVIPAPGAIASLPAKPEDYAARWASDAYEDKETAMTVRRVRREVITVRAIPRASSPTPAESDKASDKKKKGDRQSSARKDEVVADFSRDPRRE